jgi:Mg2+/Co2+ transporter CorB
MPDVFTSSLETILMVTAIVVLLLLSGFFNLSETALTAASRARMHALEGEGNKKAGLVNRLLSAPEKLIGAVLVGNTFVDVMAAALATSLAVDLVGPAGVAYATAIVTLLIVIFSAVLPKTFAFASPDRMALLVAPIMRAIIAVLSPIIIAVEFVVRQLLKLTPSKQDDKANILAAHQELRGAIDLQHREGGVKKGDRDMLGGVLDLPGLTVKDIMVHRTKMQLINADDPVPKILDEVLKNQYTRMPVWRDDPDNIIGVLNAKDIMGALSAVGWNLARLDIKALIKDAWFVPETRNLKDQLNAFLRRKAHVALIVDEYGVVQGLVTLEDILEEIVGQISDETDSEGAAVRVQADGMVVVDGSVHIRDLNRQMDWNLPDEEATTVAGLVIHEAQTIPEQGQVFTFHEFRFEILRKARNRITLVRIKPPNGKEVAAGKAVAPTSNTNANAPPAE